MRGLDVLQKHLDANTIPDDWPQDVCRDAWCGYWERNNGYVWHRASDHPSSGSTATEAYTCGCDGCWACKGRERGCTCDVDWEKVYDRSRHADADAVPEHWHVEGDGPHHAVNGCRFPEFACTCPSANAATTPGGPAEGDAS